MVPVGTTQFSHLYTGQPMDAGGAGALLAQVSAWATRALAERGIRWVTGSDELYLLAGTQLPDEDHYGEFAQVENGVGAVTLLRKRVREGIPELPRLDGKRIAVVTGSAPRRARPTAPRRSRTASSSIGSASGSSARSATSMAMATSSASTPACGPMATAVRSPFRSPPSSSIW